jgi:hypothetical protein
MLVYHIKFSQECYNLYPFQFVLAINSIGRLCGLVVRVSGYRSGGPGFDSRHYKKVVGLERGPLSLVSATE